jgi:hypothetical protein
MGTVIECNFAPVAICPWTRQPCPHPEVCGLRYGRNIVVIDRCTAGRRFITGSVLAFYAVLFALVLWWLW